MEREKRCQTKIKLIQKAKKKKKKKIWKNG